MRRIIFFGDSFTKGHGCLEGFDYYNLYPSGKLWVELVAEKFNCSIVNLSGTGKSNEDIIYNVLDFLPNKEKNDIVLIGTTSASRTNFFLKDGSNYNFSGRKATLSYKELSKEINNRPPSLNSGINLNDFTEVEFDSLSKYVVNIKVPYYDKWDKYYTTLYNNIENLFNSNVHVWSYKIWDKFESISQHTNGKIEDSHWSWNGHKDFANYLIPIIGKKFKL